MPVTRTLGRLFTLSALLILAALAAILAFVHPRFLIGTLAGDDAGYYLAIARNACLGFGLSFDRVQATNGFNPMMPTLLVPAFRALAPGLDLIACFRIAVLLTWVAVAYATLPLSRLTRRVLDATGFPAGLRDLAVGALLLLHVGFVALKGYYAMDAFLVLAFGLAYLERSSRVGLLAPGSRAAIVDGGLLACTVFARVDTLPLVVAAFMGMLPEVRRDRTALGRAAGRGLVFVGALVPYLVWNRVRFGDWLPISAKLKSSFPSLDFAASLETVFHSSLNLADQLAVLAALASALIWLGLRLLQRAPRATAAGPVFALRTLDVFALYLAGRLGWMMAFSRLDVQGSYFILAHAFIAIMLLVAAGRLGAGRLAGAAAVGIALIALGLGALKCAKALPTAREIATGRGDEWQIARDIHAAVGEPAVIYGGAFGLIGYFADRPWINGDGVANDRSYQDAIANQRLAAYLHDRHVTFIAVAVPAGHPEPVDGRYVFTVESKLHGVADTLYANRRDRVLDSWMHRSGGSNLWLVRWRDPWAAGSH